MFYVCETCALLGYVLTVHQARAQNCESECQLRHACPSAWNNQAPTEWSCIKFDISVFFETLRKAKIHYNLVRNTGTLNENQFTFLIISRPALLIITNVSDSSCRKNANTHFMSTNFFYKNLAVCEMCGKMQQSRTGHKRHYGACAWHGGYVRP